MSAQPPAGRGIAMRYSQLVPLLVCLLEAFGVPSEESDFQEDCAGEGALTCGIRVSGFGASGETWLVTVLQRSLALSCGTPAVLTF